VASRLTGRALDILLLLLLFARLLRCGVLRVLVDVGVVCTVRVGRRGVDELRIRGHWRSKMTGVGVGVARGSAYHY